MATIDFLCPKSFGYGLAARLFNAVVIVSRARGLRELVSLIQFYIRWGNITALTEETLLTAEVHCTRLRIPYYCPTLWVFSPVICAERSLRKSFIAKLWRKVICSGLFCTEEVCPKKMGPMLTPLIGSPNLYTSYFFMQKQGYCSITT